MYLGFQALIAVALTPFVFMAFAEREPTFLALDETGSKPVEGGGYVALTVPDSLKEF